MAPIKFYADRQLNWPTVVETLARERHHVTPTDELSIHGDAPKDFVLVKEFSAGRPQNRRRFWIKYIAKVGSKFYPLESVTEHLLTRIGQIVGLNIADSRLCIVDKQVRFLSKYFLRQRSESLVHGIEIFQTHLRDKQFVQAIADQRREPEFFTFQTIREAIEAVFPDCQASLMGGVVEMIGFDAIVGHNDRHPANWGVIVPASRQSSVRFAPIFDTARAMFWNNSEQKIALMLGDKQAYDAYFRRPSPQIGWNGQGRIGHFELVRGIWTEFPEFRKHLERLVRPDVVDSCARMVDGEFRSLLSSERRTLICRCLSDRYTNFCRTLK